MDHFKCFLCLVKCDYDYSQSQDELQRNNKLILSVLANYLSVSFSGDISTPLLCLECQTLMDTFKRLHQSLLLAQMKVDACLKQIKEAMVVGDEFDDGLEVGINMKLLRGDIIRRSTSRLKRFQPQIKLNRIQAVTVPVPNKSAKLKGEELIGSSKLLSPPLLPAVSSNYEECSSNSDECPELAKTGMVNSVIKVEVIIEERSCDLPDEKPIVFMEASCSSDSELPRQEDSQSPATCLPVQPPKKFLCRRCQKSFAHKQSLIIHQRSHTGERPYSCPDCGESFAQVATMNRHRRRVHLPKTLECMECGRKFGCRDYFVKHMRIHTGEKPYQCGKCGMHFRDKSALNQHYNCRHR